MRFSWNQILVTAFFVILGPARTISRLVENFDDRHHELLRDDNDDGVIDYRLPTTLSPESYTILLTPYFNNFTFDGDILIIVNVINDTNTISLHTKDLVINQIQINNTVGVMLPVTGTQWDSVTEILTISLENTLSSGTSIYVAMNFVGTLNDDMVGFYRSYYTDANGNTVWIAATQFQPTHARQAFPCLDEPNYKAKFRISINRPEELHALSNMPLRSSSAAKNGRVTDAFDESVPMSTYLVAFIVSDFESISSANGNFSVWARSNGIYQGEYALSLGPKLLSYFTETLGHDYPIQKMDMAAIPDFSWGAMENWGLITYRETAMLYDDYHSSSANKIRVATVVAHELTHMWFGNLITLAYWDYAWLNEGFARRFQYLATDSLESDWNLSHQFVVISLQKALLSDGSPSAHPLSTSVSTRAEIYAHFDTISYDKGAGVIRMMEHILGQSIFFTALNNYIEANKYANVEPQHLWDAIQDQVDANDIFLDNQTIATIMNTWTTQSGHPVIRVDFDENTGVAKISQQRFLLKPSNTTATNVTWWIPLTFVSASNPDFENTTVTHWLGDESITIQVNNGVDEWVLFNIQELGFFRVNYDEKSWNRLINLLNSDDFEIIHVLNRAQIIDDVLNLARGGYIDYSIALDATKYLRREINYYSWKALFNGFDYLTKHFRGQSVWVLYKTHLLSIIDNVYVTLGFNERESDDFLDGLNRQQILKYACTFGHQGCISNSVKLFATFKANSSALISPNLREAVYCTAIKHGDESDWNFLWEQYLSANLAAEQTTILSALGCTENSTIIETYLRYAIRNNSGIRYMDSSTVFGAVYTYGGVVGLETVIDFIAEYYKEMEAYYGDLSEVSSILSGVAGRLSTSELIEKYEIFVETYGTNLSSIESNLKYQLATAKYDLNWYHEIEETIINWLTEEYSSKTIDYRLPTNVKPTSYTILMMPDLSNFSFSATVKITAIIVEETNKIVLHYSSDLTIVTSTIVSRTKAIPIVSRVHDPITEKATFTLAQNLTVGTIITLSFEYSGILKDSMVGFYRSSYVNANGETRWLATTKFEATHARKAFPCFDEPAFKAKFIIRIQRTEDYSTMSNMPFSYQTISGSYIWDTYKTSIEMSTYLVAFVISDFSYLSDTTGYTFKFNAWARPNAIDQANYAVTYGPKALHYFELLFNHQYQIEKMDMVAIPDFAAGAMENWGLIAYRETRMLYDENHSSVSAQQVVAAVITHECTHMWFGNLVSPKWWNALWLNEAFARYYQYIATAKIEVGWNIDQQFVVEQLQVVYNIDGLESSHPMTYAVSSQSEIAGIFNSITYAKGASVIRMTELFLGTRIFNAALYYYLEAHQYNVAEPDDLWEAIQIQVDSNGLVLGSSVKTILESWTTQAGFPVLSVTIDKGVATLKQERYFLRNLKSTSAAVTWWIPITWTYASNANFNNTFAQYWFSNESTTINVNDGTAEWIIFNVQESGFYRVNYDNASWYRIITQLESENFEVIHELNRAAIVDDLLNLARAGYLGYEVALDGLQYIIKETNYLPYKSAFTALAYLNQRFAGHSSYYIYAYHMLNLTQETYDTLGFDDRIDDSWFTLLLRREILAWACRFGHENCIATSLQYFANWRANSSRPVPKNQRTVVYNTAIKHGSSDDWQFLWQEYLNANVAAEQAVILTALGCSENVTLLERYLLYAITSYNESGIRLQDSTTVFTSVYSCSLVGAEYVLEFVAQYYIQMYEYYGSYTQIGSIISGAAQYLSTEELVNKFELFIQIHQVNLSSIISTLESSLTLAQYERQWSENNLVTIITWILNKYGSVIDVPESTTVTVTVTSCDVNISTTISDDITTSTTTTFDNSTETTSITIGTTTTTFDNSSETAATTIGTTTRAPDNSTETTSITIGTTTTTSDNSSETAATTIGTTTRAPDNSTETTSITIGTTTTTFDNSSETAATTIGTTTRAPDNSTETTSITIGTTTTTSDNSSETAATTIGTTTRAPDNSTETTSITIGTTTTTSDNSSETAATTIGTTTRAPDNSTETTSITIGTTTTTFDNSSETAATTIGTTTRAPDNSTETTSITIGTTTTTSDNSSETAATTIGTTTRAPDNSTETTSITIGTTTTTSDNSSETAATTIGTTTRAPDNSTETTSITIGTTTTTSDNSSETAATTIGTTTRAPDNSTETTSITIGTTTTTSDNSSETAATTIGTTTTAPDNSNGTAVTDATTPTTNSDNTQSTDDFDNTITTPSSASNGTDNQDTTDTTDYRLPTNILPSRYNISVIPYIEDGNFTFDGTVQIGAVVALATNTIVLHIDQITYHNVTVTLGSSTLDIESISNSTTYHFLIITLKSMLTVGSNITITITYQGTLNTEMKGFYRSSYVNTAGRTRWLAATHLEAVGARRMFPCFDEPALKAIFQIRVSRPKGYLAISNMPLSSSSVAVNGRVWDTFKDTPIMSTYLVALIVSDFSYLTDVTLFYRVWSRGNAIAQTEYALFLMQPLVALFENKLNLKYQLPKLDMAALPDFSSGAMENWGLLTYKETRMLYHEYHSSLTDKQVIANVISHEISHQWFGNLVSPLWWKYLWLNEGFARYFQYHAMAQLEPNWGLEYQFVVQQLEVSFAVDGLSSSHPMTYDVYSPTEIRGIFDTISYAKAASIIRMMEKIFGTALFNNALQNYLKAREYDVATPEDLFDAFQTQVNATGFKLNTTVQEVMNTWTTQAGFPVVSVVVENGTATFSQERFLLRNYANSPINVTWWVPITWATKSNPDFNTTTPKYWLNESTGSVVLNSTDEWVIFNVQEAGYYRVNYDTDSWQRIIHLLKNDDLDTVHVLNRASIMDDLFNLGRPGYVHYSTILSATQYLLREANHLPWLATFNALVYLKRRVAGRHLEDLFQKHILTIIQPNYDRLGFLDIRDEDYYDKLLRPHILTWACDYGHEKCISKSLQLFAAWRVNSFSPIPVNQRATVYCTAIKHGSSEDWQFLWQKYLNSNYATEKITMLKGLGCSRNTTILHDYLKSAITQNSGIRFQDSSTVFSSVYSTGIIGANYTLDFIEEYYNDMYDYYGNFNNVRKYMSGLSLQFSTKELVEKYAKFIDNHGSNLTSIANSLRSYLARAHYELNWYTKYSPPIYEWLDTTYPSKSYRLPTTIYPSGYNIYLTPYLEEDNFVFEGEVTIKITVAENTSAIILQANELTINTVAVYQNSTDRIHVSSYTLNPTTHRFSIYLNSTVVAGTTLFVYIFYTGILNDDMTGFYRSSYTDEAGETHWIATTQFQPTHARKAFPCFDEPAFKAKFNVHIERLSSYRTLSNMPLNKSVTSDMPYRTWDTYSETPIMSSYLVAFIVSDFESLTNTHENFSVWARPNAIPYADYSLRVGQEALRFLENYTGVAYPLSKMDMAAIPDFSSGAMENWGLVTYREYGLLASDNVTSATFKKYLTTIISHELVHMWFGNLVTCDWWDYTWLNEGFAQYFQWVASDSIQPEWNLLQQFVVYQLQVAMQADASPTIHPMNHDVSSPASISSGFDTIAYGKAASVIRMMHYGFGSKVFTNALHNYLLEHQYSTVLPEYLWDAMQTQVDKYQVLGDSNISVSTIMNSWASQSGVPLVHASLNNGVLTLSQERFLLDSSLSSSYDYTFWIPITYTTASSANFNTTTTAVWLGAKKTSIDLGMSDEWLILNIQEVGYYRVNYDKTNWPRLIAILKSDRYEIIHEINRAQIIDDLLNLARGRYVEYDLALNATQYLAKESNHLPWKAFFNDIAYWTYRFEGQSINNAFGEYILEIVDKAYQKLSFEDSDDEGQLNELNRQLILKWACQYGHEECIARSKELFSAWRADETKWISPNARPTVYCTALKYGSHKDWVFLWNRYLESNFGSEKVVILNALGCTQNKAILENYLSITITTDNVIRKQDISTVFSSVYTAGQVGLEATLNFLYENYKDVYSYYNTWSKVGSLFSSAAAHISTQEQIETLEAFIAANENNIVEIVETLNSAVSTAKANYKWFETNSPDILAWLKSRNNNNEDMPEESKTTTASSCGNSSETDKEESGLSRQTKIILITLLTLLLIILLVTLICIIICCRRKRRASEKIVKY